MPRFGAACPWSWCGATVFVPLAEDGERLSIVVAPPVAESEVDRLELLLRRPVVVHVGDPVQIDAIIERNTNSSFLLGPGVRGSADREVGTW